MTLVCLNSGSNNDESEDGNSRHLNIKKETICY